MLTIVIKDNGEKTVTQMTYNDLWREVKDIPGAQIVVADNWFDAIKDVTTKLVCLVEADCLVSSGYFMSLVGHINKNAMELNKMAVLSSSTAVNNWAVKFYGYNIGNTYSEKIIPNKAKKDTKRPFYTMQIGYIPGAVMRTKFLREIIDTVKPQASWTNDLVFMSTELSIGFWKRGWMVYLAPGATYCTTEDYVNDVAAFELDDEPLVKKFHKESI